MGHKKLFESLIHFLFYLETYVKDVGFEKLFSFVIEQLTELAEEGVVLTINGREIQVFFVCALFLGDDKYLFYLIL